MDAVDAARVVPLTKQLGYLNLVTDILKQLRTLLLPYLPSLLRVTMHIAYDASILLVNHRDSVDARYTLCVLYV